MLAEAAWDELTREEKGIAARIYLLRMASESYSEVARKTGLPIKRVSDLFQVASWHYNNTVEEFPFRETRKVHF